jgi:hypothetical protein
MKRLSSWLGLSLLIVSAPSLARSLPVSVSPEIHSDVVTSMAASARVYAPSELPLTGRNCAEVLDDLQGRASFLGEIRAVYHPTADASTCYNLRGRQEQVAVVCCGPQNANAR